ncbi:MAG: extracellular solute-binding protein [Planctomycetota bacterium]|jgi:raffinose/stachyose/melibiose transport system substrate-binding protein
MRRGATLSLLCCLVLTAGCGKDEGGKEPPAAKKLTFWHIQTKSPTKDVIADAVKRFEAGNPGCSVEVLTLENDAFKNKLRVAMAAGSPPDVFHTWGGGALAAECRAGRVLDLKGRLEAKAISGFHDAALAFCTAWAEFGTACDKLKGGGVTPIALGNADSWPGAFYFIYFALRQGGTGPFAAAAGRKPGKGFEHESFITAGSMVRQLAESGRLSGGFNGRNYTQMRGDFFSGKTAMMLMGSWILANARKEAPEGFLEKMGCFAFPALGGSGADQSLVVGGVNAGYAVSSGCKHPDLAVRLLLELTSRETAKAWAGTGRIPALKTARVAEFLKPETRDPAAVLERAAVIQLYYDQALPPELAQVHKSTTEGLFAGTKTPEEAARTMEDKAKAIAAREGK